MSSDTARRCFQCYASPLDKLFDVVGVGLNATDTLILVDRFPAYAGKVPFTREILSPGGQVPINYRLNRT